MVRNSAGYEKWPASLSFPWWVSRRNCCKAATSSVIVQRTPPAEPRTDLRPPPPLSPSWTQLPLTGPTLPAWTPSPSVQSPINKKTEREVASWSSSERPSWTPWYLPALPPAQPRRPCHPRHLHCVHHPHTLTTVTMVTSTASLSTLTTLTILTTRDTFSTLPLSLLLASLKSRAAAHQTSITETTATTPFAKEPPAEKPTATAEPVIPVGPPIFVHFQSSSFKVICCYCLCNSNNISYRQCPDCYNPVAAWIIQIGSRCTNSHNRQFFQLLYCFDMSTRIPAKRGVSMRDLVPCFCSPTRGWSCCTWQ